MRERRLSQASIEFPATNSADLPAFHGGEPLQIEALIEAIARRAASYLTDEAAIEVIDVDTVARIAADELALERLTVLIGMGGPSGILIAFSFSPDLGESLLRHTAAILEIAPGEEQKFLYGTLAETANVIVGNAVPGEMSAALHATMTPPVILEAATRIHHVEGASFAAVSLSTGEGHVDIYLVWPQKLFVHILDKSLQGA